MKRETHKMCRFENPYSTVFQFSAKIVQYLQVVLSDYSVDSLAKCQTAESNSKFVDTQTPQSDVLFEHFISNYTSFASTLLGRFSIRSIPLDVYWVTGSGSHSVVQIILKVQCCFCFGFCTVQLSCSTLNTVNYSLMDPALYTGRHRHAKIEKALQTVGTTLEAHPRKS